MGGLILLLGAAGLGAYALMGRRQQTQPQLPPGGPGGDLATQGATPVAVPGGLDVKGIVGGIGSLVGLGVTIAGALGGGAGATAAGAGAAGAGAAASGLTAASGAGATAAAGAGAGGTAGATSAVMTFGAVAPYLFVIVVVIMVAIAIVSAVERERIARELPIRMKAMATVFKQVLDGREDIWEMFFRSIKDNADGIPNTFPIDTMRPVGTATEWWKYRVDPTDPTQITAMWVGNPSPTNLLVSVDDNCTKYQQAIGRPGARCYAIPDWAVSRKVPLDVTAGPKSARVDAWDLIRKAYAHSDAAGDQQCAELAVMHPWISVWASEAEAPAALHRIAAELRFWADSKGWTSRARPPPRPPRRVLSQAEVEALMMKQSDRLVAKYRAIGLNAIGSSGLSVEAANVAAAELSGGSTKPVPLNTRRRGLDGYGGFGGYRRLGYLQPSSATLNAAIPVPVVRRGRR